MRTGSENTSPASSSTSIALRWVAALPDGPSSCPGPFQTCLRHTPRCTSYCKAFATTMGSMAADDGVTRRGLLLGGMAAAGGTALLARSALGQGHEGHQ